MKDVAATRPSRAGPHIPKLRIFLQSSVKLRHFLSNLQTPDFRFPMSLGLAHLLDACDKLVHTRAVAWRIRRCRSYSRPRRARRGVVEPGGAQGSSKLEVDARAPFFALASFLHLGVTPWQYERVNSSTRHPVPTRVSGLSTSSVLVSGFLSWLLSLFAGSP